MSYASIRRMYSYLQDTPSRNGRIVMKSYDSRVYGINDFVQWDRSDQLVLSPKFQRRQVWNSSGKSYLIDTILRGKPIPKIFLRQKTDVLTQTTIREVVDGQQRLATILSYLKDGFVVNRRHNQEYGGLYFSDLPDEAKGFFLNYEISVDVLNDLPDAEVLDVFSRLNSYAVVLNSQEKINAQFFGPFKMLADKIGHKYYSFWVSQRIITENQVMRMAEVELTADLLIAMTAGIKSKKTIKKYYELYESEFPFDSEDLEAKFDVVIEAISKVYPHGLMQSEFHRVHLFYSLFTAFFEREYVDGCVNLLERLSDEKQAEKLRVALSRVDEIMASANAPAILADDELRFLDNARRATTDESVRRNRTEFIKCLMEKARY